LKIFVPEFVFFLDLNNQRQAYCNQQIKEETFKEEAKKQYLFIS